MSLTGYATSERYYDGTPQVTKTFTSPTVIDHDDIKAWLKANPEIDYVAIPQTWYGYGASLYMLSNARTIPRHYGKRVRSIGYVTEYCFTRTQMLRYADLAETVLGLLNDYPVFDEQHHSEMEFEAKRGEMVSALGYKLEESTDTISEWLDTEAMSDWWEYAEIDTDGVTVYISEDNLEVLAARWNGK